MQALTTRREATHFQVLVDLPCSWTMRSSLPSLTMCKNSTLKTRTSAPQGGSLLGKAWLVSSASKTSVPCHSSLCSKRLRIQAEPSNTWRRTCLALMDTTLTYEKCFLNRVPSQTVTSTPRSGRTLLRVDPCGGGTRSGASSIRASTVWTASVSSHCKL